MDWSTGTAPALTVSLNVMTSVPDDSSRVGATAETVGATKSAVSCISVLEVEAAIFRLETSVMESALRYRWGSACPMNSCRNASVSVMVTTLPAPLEDTVLPVSAMPPDMPEPSRTKISPSFTSAEPVLTTLLNVIVSVPVASSRAGFVTEWSAGGVVSTMSFIWVLDAEAAMSVFEKSAMAPAAKYRCGSLYPTAVWRCVSVSTTMTSVPTPDEDTVAPVSAVPPLVPDPSRM